MLCSHRTTSARSILCAFCCSCCCSATENVLQPLKGAAAALGALQHYRCVVQICMSCGGLSQHTSCLSPGEKLQLVDQDQSSVLYFLMFSRPFLFFPLGCCRCASAATPSIRSSHPLRNSRARQQAQSQARMSTRTIRGLSRGQDFCDLGCKHLGMCWIRVEHSRNRRHR